jgi:hypothetical protein
MRLSRYMEHKTQPRRVGWHVGQVDPATHRTVGLVLQVGHRFIPLRWRRQVRY